MKEIALVSGEICLVDDSEYEALIKFIWYAERKKGTCYAITPKTKDRKAIKMHRMILGLTDPDIHVDHIDGNGLNNQRENLRECTNAENMRNSPNFKAPYGYRGITPCGRKWQAGIRYNNRRLYLGVYETKELAAEAYNAAAKKYHKDFAVLNKINK